MSCSEVAAAILDGPGLAAAEVEAHLATCERCRAVHVAHRNASALGGDPVPSMPAPDYRAEVSKRRMTRGFAAGGVAVAAALALGLWFAGPEQAPAGPSPIFANEAAQDFAGPRETDSLPVAEVAQHEAPSSLEDLFASIDAYATRDPSVNDFTYAAFGSLPQWVALPTSASLNLNLEDQP